MTVSALSPIPNVYGDPQQFNDDTVIFFGTSLPNMISQFNTDINLLNFNSTNSTSATSNTVSLGTKTFTVQTGKSYVTGMYLTIAVTATPNVNNMLAQVISYSGSTLTVSVLAFVGSGSATAWTISLSTYAGDIYAAWTNYTPTLTAGTGTLTTFVTTGKYKKIGRTVHFIATYNIVQNGTGASHLIIGIPFTSGGGFTCVGREDNISGGALVGIGGTGNSIRVYRYNNDYPGVNAALGIITGTYESAT